VNELSLKIEEGSIKSLIGPNGAGKTCVFNCLTGFYKAASGDMFFQGKSLMVNAPHLITKSGIARTFQNLRLFKQMTVLENVMSGMHSRTRAGFSTALLRTKAQREEEQKIREAAEECLDFVGILGKEQQMLAIGRAMMASPKVLLLDEPSMGLAPIIVQNIMKTIKQINEQGTTILLVEQNAKVALKLAHRGYVLETGEIVMQGEAATLSKDESIVKAYPGE